MCCTWEVGLNLCTGESGGGEEYRGQMGKDWREPVSVRRREIAASLVLCVCLDAVEPPAEKSRITMLILWVKSIWAPGSFSVDKPQLKVRD